MPTDGPDHTTRPFWSGVEFQAGNAQLVRSAGANVSVMVLQGHKSSPQKSRPLDSGHRRHGVCIAIYIECSYKLGSKNKFKFLCELCTFLQIRSQISSSKLMFFCSLCYTKLNYVSAPDLDSLALKTLFSSLSLRFVRIKLFGS